MVTPLDTLDLPAPDGRVVVFDTEASGLHVDEGARVSIVSLAWRGDDGSIESRVYPFDQGACDKVDLPGRYQESLLDLAPPNLGRVEWDALLDWMGRQLLVAHNAKYDLHIVAAGLRTQPGSGRDLSGSLHWDTMVVAPNLWPNEPVLLDAIGKRLGLGGKTDDGLQDWLRRHGKRYDLAPLDLIGPYAAQDAVLTLQIYEVEQAGLECGDLDLDVAEREVDLAICLFRMERRGLPFDRDLAWAESRRLSALIVEARAALQTIVNRRPSEAVMRHYWFGSTNDGGLGLRPRAKTEKGQPSVTLDVVRALVEEGVSGAQEWQTSSALETAQSMWYAAWPALCGADNRLRTSYRQTKTAEGGTISGRLAVERVNLQAIPHDYQLPEGLVPVRGLIVAGIPEGRALVECDLSQAEFRVAAGVAKCQAMTDLFAQGYDVHSGTARLMFGVDESDPLWSKYRNIAKRLGFGMVYGAGAPKIRAEIQRFTGLDVSQDECDAWLRQYRTTYPELGRTSYQVQRRAERAHHVVLAGGRERWWRANEPTYKAFNALIQGGVAEVMKQAMIEIESQGFTLLAQIHDSVIVECPAGEVEAAAGEVKRLLCAPFEQAFGVPFEADAKTWGSST